MIRNRIISVAGIAIMFFALSTQAQFAAVQTEVNININGSSIIMQGDTDGEQLSALIVDGRTMAPIRPIFSKFKLDLNWNSSDSSITTKTPDGRTIWMQVGNKIAKLDGVNYAMDVSPQIIADKTYVPVKYLFDFLGVEYEWDGDNGVVVVNAPNLIQVNVPEALKDIYGESELITDDFYVIRNKIRTEKVALVNVSSSNYADEFKASASKMGLLISDFSEVNNITFRYKYFNIEGSYAGVVLEKNNQVLSIEFENFTFDEIEEFLNNY
ncbi:MAG: copper amine oxidase N-terminal domain-containing protein [Acidaminobacteraceae bacterium]